MLSSCQILTHMIHGAGIFTYMTGWFCSGESWQIYHHHGLHVGNVSHEILDLAKILGYNPMLSSFSHEMRLNFPRHPHLRAGRNVEHQQLDPEFGDLDHRSWDWGVGKP